MTKVVVLRKALNLTYPGSRDGAFIGRPRGRRLAKFLADPGRNAENAGLERLRAAVFTGCDGRTRRFCIVDGTVLRGSAIAWASAPADVMLVPCIAPWTRRRPRSARRRNRRSETGSAVAATRFRHVGKPRYLNTRHP